MAIEDMPGYATRGLFGSAHINGFQMAFCDGSVHMMNFSMNPKIHDYLGNRKDGHVIDAKTCERKRVRRIISVSFQPPLSSRKTRYLRYPTFPA